MSVPLNKCHIISTKENTPGGETYIVKLPGARAGKAVCFRKIHKRPELRCENPAGFRTTHQGTGACFLHGGANTEAVAFSNGGKRANSTRAGLQVRVNSYLAQDRAKLLDLTEQLAVAKAVFDEFVETMPEPDADDFGTALYRFTTILSTLSTLVEKMARVDSRNQLTAAQVLYIRATIVNIFMRYIPDPLVRERAARELAARLGGDDIDVEMLPSEYNLLEDGS